MTKEQEQVKEWMKLAGQDCPEKPIENLPDKVHNLRWDLISEEMDELENACDLVAVADALGDLMYVILGYAVAHGIDLEPIFQEVHRSNMSKFIDGHRRENGKWIKGPSYSPANLQPIIEAQSK